MMTRLLIGLLLLMISCKDQPKVKGSMEEQVNQIEQDSTIYPNWLITDYCMGHFNPINHPDFEEVDVKYANRTGMWLRKETYHAFQKMWDHAQKEGIHLTIKSATRNFDYQKGIWERKWTGQTILSDGTNAKNDISDPVKRALKILEYSSMPGTSRHHWGTDFDINAFNNEYFESGEGLKVYQWMKANAKKYGFCQPYTPFGEQRSSGYQEEKWHWSYVPTSATITKYAQEKLRDSMIQGFEGAETASTIQVVDRYVLGIDFSCNL